MKERLEKCREIKGRLEAALVPNEVRYRAALHSDMIGMVGLFAFPSLPARLTPTHSPTGTIGAAASRAALSHGAS